MAAGQTFTGTAHRRTSRWSGMYLHIQHSSKAESLRVDKILNAQLFSSASSICVPACLSHSGPLCTVATAARPNSLWSRQTVRQANLQLRPPPVKMDLALMPGPAIVVLLCSLQPMYSHQNPSQPCSEETLVRPWPRLNLLSQDQLSFNDTGEGLDIMSTGYDLWPS